MVTLGGRRYMNVTGTKSITVPMVQATLDAVKRLLNEVCPTATKTMIIMNDFPQQKGGYIASDATAFYREPWFNYQVVADWGDKVESDLQCEQWTDSLRAEIAKLEENNPNISPQERLVGRVGYWNASNGKSPSSIVFAKNYPRLREIKKKYDPENIFNKWYPIQPAA